MKALKILIVAAIVTATPIINVFANPQTAPLSGAGLLAQADRDSLNSDSSPVRRIERDQNKRPSKKQFKYRTIDGSFNNKKRPDMNTAGTQLGRSTFADYSDGVASLAGALRPGPREISNLVVKQAKSVLTKKPATDFLWQWGQFLDHDIDLTDGAVQTESADIKIPSGDIHFDPMGHGDVYLPFNRSIYDIASGTGQDNPRQQLNEISGWMDASNVYGSDVDRANELRRRDGSGRLKTSKNNLLPYNLNGFPNAGGTGAELFLAGDVRANEQVGLTAMHTLFVREHNRLATEIRLADPSLTGEEIYQAARNFVAAEMQVITYREFLPVLLGPRALSKYKKYKPKVDASITNEFSTAAYRFGHSLLSPQILRLNKNGKETRFGHLALRDAFFAPQRITKEGGIGPILRGLAGQACQRLDVRLIDDVRNFLFGNPGAGGFDLASLNIQRGRDHGLPSYNDVRESLGLDRVSSFKEMTSNKKLRTRLTKAYTNVDEIDLWVGGLAEDHVKGALVGEVFFTILKDQFERLRDGDRFWYERHFQGEELDTLAGTTLATVIRRNTKVGEEIQDNVFILNSKP